jgi:phenylpropionate dioxygenase-like ring-hydroxylating dioxygenase large terminal subunit
MNDQKQQAAEQFAGVRQPLTRAWNLPPHCYVSQEWYEREVSQMWSRSWILLGRREEVPNPGDYVRVDFLDEPLIMIRGHDGEIRVFSAICRHRGCIVKEGCGNDKYISCPYHGWTYDLLGRLVAVPGMAEAEDFRKEDFGLRQIRSETWGGFVFINFDASAEPLMTSLSELARRFEQHRLEDMHVARKIVNRVEANWKLWLENSRDGYHANVVHAETYKKFYRGKSSVPQQYSGKEGVYEILSCGNDDGLYLPRDPVFPMVEGLSEADLQRTHFAVFYPHLLLNLPPSHMGFHQLFPHGPHATTVVTWICFPKRTLERADFDEAVKRYYEIVEDFIPEDKVIAEQTQRGLRGRLALPGRFSIHERPCHGFANWLLDRVEGGDRQGTAGKA